VCTAHLAQIQNKKAQNCSGASIDDERRKKKEDIYTHTYIQTNGSLLAYIQLYDDDCGSFSFFLYVSNRNQLNVSFIAC
jgi:hypothetical protein